MIGQIEQRYSDERYRNPRNLQLDMFVRAGAPKALFRPGSSTVVLLVSEKPHPLCPRPD